MPAESKKQRRMMAIAEHHPEKLYARNRGVLKMGRAKLHEFASTKEKGLRLVKGRRVGRRARSKLDHRRHFKKAA